MLCSGETGESVIMMVESGDSEEYGVLTCFRRSAIDVGAEDSRSVWDPDCSRICASRTYGTDYTLGRHQSRRLSLRHRRHEGQADELLQRRCPGEV